MGPVPARAHHRRQPAGPAAAPRPRRGHRRRLLPHARSQSQRRNTPEQTMIDPRGGDFYLATSGDRNLAIDMAQLSLLPDVPVELAGDGRGASTRRWSALALSMRQRGEAPLVD